MPTTTTPATTELLDLSGKTVLVTGASGNIGGAIALRLAEAGAMIVAHYFSNEAAVLEIVAQSGGRSIQADLSKPQDTDRLVREARADLLVNNAALQPVQALREMTFEDWRQVLAANLDAAFLLSNRMAQHWLSEGTAGVIVNIASIEGQDPAAGHAHYASSKAGLTMLTRAMALEYGDAGIRVNAVSPGLIDRTGLEQDWPEGVERWRQRVPLGRIGSPNDVADAVLFLLSPAARWISAANLIVDGGMSAQSKW